MKISIIIPVFNQLTYTQQMYESLQATLPDDLDIEVLFVDDASSDDTPAWLRSIASTTPSAQSIKSVRVLTNPVNLGYAKSNNLAAKESMGDLLLLLNNDLVLKPAWLEPMVEIVEKNRTQSIVVGNFQYLPGSDSLDHAGFQVRHDTEAKRTVIEHIRDFRTDEPHKVFAVTGACFLIPRQTFEDLGRFDEAYINGGEDVDLCLKVKEHGGQCWVAPKSAVWHYVSQTRGNRYERDEANSLRLFKKWNKQIARDLEPTSAEILNKSIEQNSTIKRIVQEYLDGVRSLAPIEVKFLAQKYVDDEIAFIEERIINPDIQKNKQIVSEIQRS